MKIKILLLIGLIISIWARPVKAQSYVPCNVADSLALVDFYNHTNGPVWGAEAGVGWLQGHVYSWYGITLNPLGRVSGIYMELINMKGSIPATFGNLTGLTQLTIHDCGLSGVIPSSFGSLINLTDLELYGNQLTGTIPSALGSLKNLTELDLGNNKLSGTIPAALGNLSNLSALYLGRNQLIGPIPANLANLKNISGNFIMDLSQNRLNFDGLEQITSKLNAPPYANYNSFSPQASIKLNNKDGKLSIMAGGTLSNNSYSWYEYYGDNQFGGPVATITGDSTYQIKKAPYYYASITNAIVGGYLTLYSDTISVTQTVQPLTVDLIGAYPSMIDINGKLLTDVSKIDMSNTVVGAATDGVSKILLVAKSDVALTYTLNSKNDGSLTALNGNGNGLSLTIQPVNGVVVAVYTAPDGYGNNLYGKTIDVQVNDPNNSTTTATIELFTPPVIMVHGMWSSPQVWRDGNFVSYLQGAGFYDIVLADYSDHSSYTFSPLDNESIFGTSAVLAAIKKGLDYYRSQKIASTQVDIVAHSLGGLMTRTLSQQNIFIDNSNSKMGPIHKLITLGTPHRGSPLGPALWNVKDNLIINTALNRSYGTVGDFLKNRGMPIGSCHRDFDINSAAINALQQTLPFKSYAICGNYVANPSDPGTKTLTWGQSVLDELCSVVTGKRFDAIFASRCPNDGVLPTDLIVPLISQNGYINSSMVFYGTGHSTPAKASVFSPLVTETNSLPIQVKVRELLLSNDTTEFSKGFPAPSDFALDCNTPNGTEITTVKTNIKSIETISRPVSNINTDSVYSANHNSLKIVSPMASATFANDGRDSLILTLQFTDAAKLAHSLFIVQGVGLVAMPSKAPFSTKIALSNSMSPGLLNIAAIGSDIYGNIFADTLNVNIQSTDTLKSLTVRPSPVILDSLNRVQNLYVLGSFKSLQNTVSRDITAAGAGTTYTTLHNTIISVSAAGQISAIKTGTDTVIVRNHGIVAKVPVTVDPDLFKVKKLANKISLSVSDGSYGDKPFILKGTSTSGAAITYTLLSGPVSISNGIVTINGAGTVKIVAKSAGNAYFNTAPNDTITFNIKKAAQTISFNPLKTTTYGQADFDASAIASSGLPVSYTSNNIAVATIVNNKIHIVGAGTVTITALQTGNVNYNAATGVTQSLVISPAALTITATSFSKTYGAVNPVLTVTFAGFVNGDTKTALTTQPILTTTATRTSIVGVYPITAAGAVTSKYTIKYIAGNLRVNRAPLTITAINCTKIYGSPNPALSVSFAGFVVGDTKATLTSQPILTTTATAASTVGTYPISASGANSLNYVITYVKGILTVNKAPLTISAADLSKTYGSANPVLTINIQGFVNGDTRAVLTTQPKITTTATTTSSVGNYPVTVSGAVSSRYTITYEAGTLTVNKAPLKITANSLTKTYGATNPVLTASFAGFVNGDTQTALTTQPKIATIATAASAPGVYPITVNGAAAANYTLSYVAGTLRVAKASLTITANNQTKPAGSANPVLTVTYKGFVRGDTQNALTRLPNITTTATINSPAGTYPITASGAVAANYIISYVAGVLTVTGQATHVPDTNIATGAIQTSNLTNLASEERQPNVKPALSPNGDGLNDVLFIDGILNFPDNKLTVISRTGAKVFEVSGYNNISKVFDGHSNITGVMQQPGTYFYLLQYRDKGVSKRKTGYFVLKN